MRLAITGSSGYLARQLIVRLSDDPDVEFVLGLDIKPPALKLPGAGSFRHFDLTAHWEKLWGVFLSQNIDTGLHMAWQFNPIHNSARHRMVDVAGSENFFRAAEAAGLKRVVYVSSTTAYVNPGNPAEPPFLREEEPVSGTSRYLYSQHKAEVDRIAQDFMQRHPEVHVVILRPSIVLGPNTQNIVSKMTEVPWRSCPWLFHVRGADPPLQFIAEDDIEEILYRAMKCETKGVINCAGDGVVRLTELARRLGKRPLGCPAWLLYTVTEALWALRLGPFPSGILDLIRYPWVVDNTRLKTEFGYTPRLSTQEALATFVSARRDR